MFYIPATNNNEKPNNNNKSANEIIEIISSPNNICSSAQRTSDADSAIIFNYSSNQYDSIEDEHISSPSKYKTNTQDSIKEIQGPDNSFRINIDDRIESDSNDSKISEVNYNLRNKS